MEDLHTTSLNSQRQALLLDNKHQASKLSANLVVIEDIWLKF